MRLNSRSTIRFLPWFISLICASCLVLESVPGGLEVWFDVWFDNILMFIFFFLARLLLLLWVLNGACLEIYQLVKSWRNRWVGSKPKIKIPFLVSLLILITTNVALYFQIPVRLHFYTSANQFQQVLDTQILNSNNSNNSDIEKYRQIKQIGNFKIKEILVSDSVYFHTAYVDMFFSSRSHGFAYVPNPKNLLLSSETHGRYTHLHGNWYIYFVEDDW
jgi:hypothetical protein